MLTPNASPVPPHGNPAPPWEAAPKWTVFPVLLVQSHPLAPCAAAPLRATNRFLPASGCAALGALSRTWLRLGRGRLGGCLAGCSSQAVLQQDLASAPAGRLVGLPGRCWFGHSRNHRACLLQPIRAPLVVIHECLPGCPMPRGCCLQSVTAPSSGALCATLHSERWHVTHSRTRWGPAGAERTPG